MPDFKDETSADSKRVPDMDSGSERFPGETSAETRLQSRSPLAASAGPKAVPTDVTSSIAGSSSRTGSDTGLPTFAANDVVANRYKIVRFIGQGGMGEVYEVEDLELHQHVAMKTVRPEIARDQQAMERFKREIRIARDVTHPNVSRIFDLGYHRSPSGQEIMFLTMELLSGETLSSRLRSQGRMSEKEALPIIRQLAAGLAAVHKLGIVHRDFKSANVVLVPSKEEEGGWRAVVADFGLARRTNHVEAGASMLSRAGDIMGTPAYMAPEQVRGVETTAAADIYALGVVMFEMVCGAQPFVADTPLATAIKRLEEKPPSPRKFAPTLDPKWDATILRCLEREAENRFASALDIVKALEGETLPFGRRVQKERDFKRQAMLMGAAAILILSITAIGYHLYQDRQGEKPANAGEAGTSGPAGKHRTIIGILGFTNLSNRPDMDYLSTALAESLTTDLEAGGDLRAISQERVSRLRQDISLSSIVSLPHATLVRAQDDLGADFLVTGSFNVKQDESGSKIHVELQLQNASARQTPFSIAADGDETNLFPLVSDMGKRIREKLAASPVTDTQEAGVKAALPAKPEATRLYADALNKLRAFDLTSAREKLQRVVNIDPTFALAHSALAETLQALGNDTAAQAEAKTGSDLAYQLIPEQRNLVEARYRSIFSEWDKAIDIYHSLWTVTDNIEYGLLLAQTQISAGQGKDALATLSSLRKLPRPAGDDPRIDYVEALAADSLSDFKGGVAATEKAVQKASKEGARYLVAEALLEQCWAFGNLSQAAQATQACEKAEEEFSNASDLLGKARTLTRLSEIAEFRGEFNHALDMRNQALAIARQIGSKKDISGALLNKGNLQATMDDLEGAKKSYEEALTAAAEIDFKKNILDADNNLGTVYQSQCEFGKAKETYEKSRITAEASGDKVAVAKAIYNIGSVLFQLGDLESAQADIKKAVEMGKEVDNKSDVADWLFTAGDVYLAKAEFDNAEKSYREARGFLAPDEKTGLAVNNLEMAGLSLERGMPADAEKLARLAADEFQSEKDVGNEAAARELIGRALMAQQRFEDAQKEIDRAQKLSPKDCAIRLPLAITAARLMARSKQGAAAQKAVERVLSEAKSKKLDGYVLEASLAQGEIELLAGKTQPAQARLRSVAALAAQRHFLLIAQKGRALLDSRSAAVHRGR